MKTQYIGGISKPGGESIDMASPRAPWFLRFFPSLTDVAFLAPILLLFGRLDGAKTMLGDGDTGWHIRAGEWMLANGRVPEQDIFSFTKSTEPWYAWEWLSDIILAALHQRFGLAGPVFFGILLLGLTSVLLFRLCRRHTGNDLVAIGITTLAVGASSIHWLARPHLFTFLFVLVTLHLLDRAYTNPRILWAMPPMVALWTNLHGAFFVGIVLMMTVGAGLFLEMLISQDNPGLKAAWARTRTYWAVALASGAASLLNPYGWQLHVHIYRYLTEKYHFEHISEFQTLSFHVPVATFFEAFVVAGLLTAGWAISRRRFADALLLMSWTHLALLAGRNIPIFAFVAAPLVARGLTEVLAVLQAAPIAEWVRRGAAGLESFGSEFSQLDRIPRIPVTSGFAAVLLLALMLGAPADASKLRSEFDPKKYPAGALAMLDGRRVFTNDEWGDYLIYKLYPKTRVFVDGRSDFYGGEFSLKSLDVLNGRWDWASELSRYDVDTVLLPAEASMASTLKESAEWKAVYDDQIAILFYRTGSPSGRNPEEKVSFERMIDGVSKLRFRSTIAMAYIPALRMEATPATPK